MSNLLLIVPPDSAMLTKERSYLSADVAPGATSLPVQSLQGFASGDRIVVGSFFTESCEAATVASSPTAGAIPVSALALGHKRGAPVCVLNYDRYKIFSDTDPTGTFTTEVTTADSVPPPPITPGGEPIDFDQTEVYYRHNSGTPSLWYKVLWFNSVNLDTTDRSNSIAFQPDRYATIDPTTLRQDYLMGIRLTDFYGNPLRDSTLLRHMRRAIAHLETYLGTIVYATDIVNEEHDYYTSDYMAWGFMKLKKHPVISVTSLSLQFPENNNLLSLPTEWIKVDKTTGQISLIPSYGTMAGYLLMRSPVAPLMLNRLENVPHVWRVNYRAGFEYDAIPEDIEDIIYKMTAVSIIGIIGDTVYGPGVASRSISIDGLSQSVGTVANAMYNTFAARLNQFNADIEKYLPQLKKRYQGIRMQVL